MEVEHVDAQCFKNGVTLFSKVLVLPKNTTFFSLPPSLSSVDSYGITLKPLDPGVSTAMFRIESREEESKQVARTFVELLRANEGRHVSVLLRVPNGDNGNASWISGKVEAVPPVPGYSAVLEAQRTRDGAERFRTIVPVVRLLVGDAEVVNVSVLDVLQVKGSGLLGEFKESALRKRLVYPSMDTDIRIHLSWLDSKLSWLPVYHAQLCPSTHKLTITGSAFVDNRKATSAYFVPKLLLSSGAPPLKGAFEGWGHGSHGAALYNKSVGMGSNVDVSPVMRALSDGEEGSDFFCYEFTDVDLQSDVTLPIFFSECAYDDLFIVECTSGHRGQGYHGKSTTQNTVLPVFHQISFSNSSTVPWTSGVISVQTNGTFLSQGPLKSTPVGVPVKLILSKVSDVHVVQNEVVANKADAAAGIITGSISLRSFKAIPIDIRVKLSMSGELKTATPAFNDNKEVSIGADDRDMDRVVVWNVRLEPGVQVSISYTTAASRDSAHQRHGGDGGWGGGGGGWGGELVGAGQ
jgi:hypothetical protein